MKSAMILLAALSTIAAPALASVIHVQEHGNESPREDETPAQRAARLKDDRLHSTHHARETAAQHAARLTDERNRAIAAERTEVPTTADATADANRLADDRARSMAHRDATETQVQRTALLKADYDRSMAKKAATTPR